MQVPDEIRKSVVFVGYRKADGSEIFGGTAFCVSREVGTTGKGFCYFVTAKHVITGIIRTGIDKVLLRFNIKDGEAISVETDSKRWITHPTDLSIDVAILPFSPIPKILDHLTFPLRMFATENVIRTEEIGVGDEIFVTGMFHAHKGKRRNIPIVRAGNIAAMPEEKVYSQSWGHDIEAYLIESRSIGGLSGSPVFVYMGLTRTLEGRTTIRHKGNATYYLLGLIHGHFDVRLINLDDITEDSMTPLTNAGIAIVVPAIKILEVMNQPAVLQEEAQQTAKYYEEHGA